MTKKYKPQWFESPFGHIRYTLCTTKKQIKNLGFQPTKMKSCGVVSFYDSCDGFSAIVFISKNNHSNLENLGLIVHESVHVWQKIKERMNEESPSKEFEAYSVQRIAQDLFHLYEVSNVVEKPTA